MTDHIDDDRYSSYPLPVFTELYADLDLQLLTATDDAARWAALIAGTDEVLERLDDLAAPNVICATNSGVIEQFATCVSQFETHWVPDMAHWLQHVIDLLTAHEELQQLCADQIRCASGQADALVAILDSTDSLRAAAERIRTHRFADLPRFDATAPNRDVVMVVMATFAAENHRKPLRNGLDGAGGAAASPEFNPYVAALYELELSTHRRLYRLFYDLLEHVGVRLRGDELFDSPELVDRQPF